AEPNGRLDRLDVAPAPVDGKGSAGAERWAEYGVEELDLGHEVELSTRPERETERPGIEVRRVVGTENEASLLRKVLEPFCANPKEPLHHRPANDPDEDVEGATPHQGSIREPTMEDGHIRVKMPRTRSANVIAVPAKTDRGRKLVIVESPAKARTIA